MKKPEFKVGDLYWTVIGDRKVSLALLVKADDYLIEECKLWHHEANMERAGRNYTYSVHEYLSFWKDGEIEKVS